MTAVGGSAATWTVTVNTGSGDGTIRLDVTDNDTILDNDGLPLGMSGLGNGDFNRRVVFPHSRATPHRR